MMAVELRDESGKELNIKSGSTATLEFPAVTSYKPSDIPLWSFNESKGWWKEEGKATLQGDKYIAKVGHFSFWNCDAPFPLIEKCGKVKFENGDPAKYFMIEVKAEGLGTSYGSTNENGEFCGKMPKGKKLTISVYSVFCNKKLITSIDVGPFDNNTILNDIIIKKQNEYRIKGSINCSGTKPTDGIIVVMIDNQRLLYRTNENGVFDIDLSGLICDDTKKVALFGFDNLSGATSMTKEFLEKPNKEIGALNTIPEEFCYMFCGHWLPGDIGEDRKNVGFLIKAFFELFKNCNDTSKKWHEWEDVGLTNLLKNNYDLPQIHHNDLRLFQQIS
jgi:hypothetical protein